MYEVKIENYTGPLEKLLGLIQERKLEITMVNLADVTADFIVYAKTLEEQACLSSRQAHPQIISDFIVVASRLMLIKSKILLPTLHFTEEEEREVADLKERLRLYRDWKVAGTLLAALWKSSKPSFGRPFLTQIEQIFCPPRIFSSAALADSMKRLVGTLETSAPKEERTVKRALVTIEEKMGELMNRLASNLEANWSAITTGQNKSEIVAMFLAMLHLLKQQRISITQEERFSDIIITSV